MWQIVKRFFIFQSKALEFGYRTWKSRRAIRRAYREGGVPARFFTAVRANARVLVLGVALAAGIVAAFIIGPKVVGYVTSAYSSARSEAIASHAAREHKALEAKREAAAKAAFAAQAAAAKKEELATAAAKPAVPLTPHPSDSSTLKPVPGPAPGPTVPGPLVPGSTAPGPSAAGLALREQMQYCILANKATKTVYLLSRGAEEGSWSVLEKFPAVMGRNEGQKQAAGDRRTPEGIYFIVGMKEKTELSTLYGPLAYVLNYPNEEDRQAGRTGQGIWIHGMPEDSTRMVTRGCIVMQNTWLVTLERYLKLGVGTPVVIIDKQDLAAPEKYPDFDRIAEKRSAILREYAQREQDFKQLLLGWKTAWASRDIDSYSQFYDSQRFFSSGMSWNAWRDRKRNIFSAFDSIDISVDNIRLVDCSESTAVVVFRQFYEAARQPAKQNAKRLCFYRSGAHWLIYREETFSTEEFLL